MTHGEREVGDGAPEEMWGGSEPLTLADYFRLLWPAKWGILLVAFACGFVALCVTLAIPNRYRATAVVKPEVADQGRAAGVLGTLANFGIQVGGPTKVEDLEVLFRSRDLAARVFQKHDLWAAVYPGRYDAASGTLAVGWLDRVLGKGQGARPPDKWDAIRAAVDFLSVATDRRTGVITISFDARDPEDTARTVGYFLEEGKSRLQEEALNRANHNKGFLSEQIEKAIDPMIRERLYDLFVQEVEREVLARNREQFGFTIIDSPEAPDRKHSPQRLVIASVSLVTGGLAACLWVLVRRPEERSGAPPDSEGVS